MKKEEKNRKINRDAVGPVTYEKLFWIFFAGSILGIFLEGIWSLFFYGNWEIHSNTMWIPLCCIYGAGAVGCYVGSVRMKKRPVWFKFLVFSLVGAGIEFLCGWFLEATMHMRAWDYSGSFLNIRGYVNLRMTILWGILGTMFDFLVPYIEAVFVRMKGKVWKVLCFALTVIVAVDFAFSSFCILRWKNRHDGTAPANRVTEWIDQKYDDEFMSDYFCIWEFIETE